MPLRFLGLLIFSALVLVACGGGGNSTDNAGPLNEEEYRAAGNEICQSWTETINELSSQLSAGASQQELIAFGTEVEATGDRFTLQLLDLMPPNELADDHEDVRVRFEERVELISNTNPTPDEVNAILEASMALTGSISAIWSSCSFG